VTPAANDAVQIYTDGGCEPNPGVGGWAAVLLFQGKEKELFGADAHATNNRMELTAAIEALRALKRPCSVLIHTDSQYVQRGVTEWLANWKRRNWRSTTGAVKNRDLWEALDAELQRHRVQWKWVRGHAGNRYNERCDELAGQAIAALKRGLQDG
jgi:ribonuclease HI